MTHRYDALVPVCARHVLHVAGMAQAREVAICRIKRM